MREARPDATALTADEKFETGGALKELTTGMHNTLDKINARRVADNLPPLDARSLAADLPSNQLTLNEYSQLMRQRKTDLQTRGNANYVGARVGSREASPNDATDVLRGDRLQRYIGDAQHIAAVKKQVKDLKLKKRFDEREMRRKIAMERRQGASPLQAILDAGGTLTEAQEASLQRQQLGRMQGGAQSIADIVAAETQARTARETMEAQMSPRGIAITELRGLEANLQNSNVPEEEKIPMRERYAEIIQGMNEGAYGDIDQAGGRRRRNRDQDDGASRMAEKVEAAQAANGISEFVRSLPNDMTPVEQAEWQEALRQAYPDEYDSWVTGAPTGTAAAYSGAGLGAGALARAMGTLGTTMDHSQLLKKLGIDAEDYQPLPPPPPPDLPTSPPPTRKAPKKGFRSGPGALGNFIPR
jgi:hypothetical protein